MTARIACLAVPMFVLAARLRSEPELRNDAVVIVEGNGGNAHVVAATRRARTKGIRSGLSLTQARSILPKLTARGRDAECERTAQDALVEVAETFSPRIENAGDGVVFFDVTGMERHFQRAESRGQRAEEEAGDDGVSALCALPSDLCSAETLLAKTAMSAAEKIGLPARCGIGASKLAARIAAELPRSPVIVPAGEEAAFLAPLPLARLTPEIDAAVTLQRWGLTSIGELARLPESEVAARLGEIGRDLHYAARGIDPRPLIPRALPPEFREGMDLEWPLVSLEPFLFIASGALDRLANRLEMQGLACRRLELTMTLEPDGVHARGFDLPAPTRDGKTMLTLLRLDLEKAPPGAPVTAFSLVAHPDRPRRAQLSLFGPAALSPEKIATAIARLAAMLGADRVGSPRSVDGHLPERYALGEFDPPPPPEMKRSPRRSRGLLAVRVFRPPLPIEVITRNGDDTRIESIQGEGDLSGPVRVCAGPWEVEEGWWSTTPAGRRYWDVELTRGGTYRIYRDSGSQWFADGRYD
jgi:protein ImuB